MEKRLDCLTVALRQIQKKHKHLRSLGPTKRPEILKILIRQGIQTNMLELTQAINIMRQ